MWPNFGKLSCVVCSGVCVLWCVCVRCRGAVAVWCVQKNLRGSIQNVPVCTRTTRTCVSTCARFAGTHGSVLNLDKTRMQREDERGETRHDKTRQEEREERGRKTSDWGRKSTGGGVVCLGHHVIKSWTSTQQLAALSSGKAELYALIKGASQTRGIISMLVDFCLTCDGTVCTDASAAMGISCRRALGRTRHLDVQYLWIQEKVAEGRLKVDKVATKENPARYLDTGCGEGRHAEALASTRPRAEQNTCSQSA